MRKKLLWILLITSLVLSVFGLNTMQANAIETHDIAIISVTPSPTSVRLGEIVNITVVVENEGDFTETFNVTVHYDATAIETKTNITLIAGANTSLTFTWNTTDVTAGSYLINATASAVPYETNTTDNTLVFSKVLVVSQYVAVIPQSTVDSTLTPGNNFTVSIYTDYNGSDIQSWQFALSYNPRVLHGVSVTNGDLVTKAKDPSAMFFSGNFDNNAGELSLTGAVFFFFSEPAPMTSGPGTLAHVTFTVVGLGESSITLGSETKLVGYTEDGYGDPYNIIDIATHLAEPLHSGCFLHGYFRNTAELVIRDIAIISVTPYPTSVKEGDPVNITVVVRNEGTVNETVTVKAYYDYNPTFPLYNVIGTKTAQNLAPGAETSLTFTWDAIAGNHTITAVASELPGETDTEDNKVQSDEIVTVVAREEPPLPILLIIGIAVVLVVVITVVVYALRRRTP